ncbi:MAG: PIN domain-containing protein [Candidatus Woesearchaeota archaeon]
MDLIVDANILFSALIKSGKTEELFFKDDLHLFAPEFIFDEFNKYKGTILLKTERTEQEFDKLLNILSKRIKTIPNEETEKLLGEAYKICPDKNDADYFALALKIKCPIWSNDKILKTQNKIDIYSTTELLNMF